MKRRILEPSARERRLSDSFAPAVIFAASHARMSFVEKNDENKGAVRVGMVWGAVGGVIGFLVSLFGSLAGMIAAIFVGISCGRRAADTEEGKRSGAISGLVGGAFAAPIYVLGAASGAVIAARQVGGEEMARVLSEIEFANIELTAEEAWNLYLASLVLSGFMQAAILIGIAALAGALAARKYRSDHASG
jgi:hypothetical protein